MMFRGHLLSLLLIGGIVRISNGFNIFDAQRAKPKLLDLANAQKDLELNIRLDVGEEKDKHMALDGLQLKLLGTKAERGHPKLPGQGGPHPKVSSGAFSAEVSANPTFVDMFGMQRVKFENGCWELVWREDAMAGTIVCGFDVPKGAKRNGAIFPAGKIYVSLVVWTPEDLVEQQAHKAAVQAIAEVHEREKNEELQKYAAETNILKKAMHYRNAAAAMEQYDFSGIRSAEKIPDNDDVIPIHDGLLLATKGTVWTKDTKGGIFGPPKKLLGSAVIRINSKEQAKEQNVESSRASSVVYTQ